MNKPSSERGGATIEMTLLTPLLLLFLLLVVLAGRSVSTKLDVDAAASVAARAASMERNADAAQAAATASVLQNVATNSKACRQMTAVLDDSAFHAGGAVTVDVTCVVDLSDLSLLRLPGTREIHGHATEPLDTYRSVQ